MEIVGLGMVIIGATVCFVLVREHLQDRKRKRWNSVGEMMEGDGHDAR